MSATPTVPGPGPGRYTSKARPRGVPVSSVCVCALRVYTCGSAMTETHTAAVRYNSNTSMRDQPPPQSDDDDDADPLSAMEAEVEGWHGSLWGTSRQPLAQPLDSPIANALQQQQQSTSHHHHRASPSSLSPVRRLRRAADPASCRPSPSSGGWTARAGSRVGFDLPHHHHLHESPATAGVTTYGDVLVVHVPDEDDEDYDEEADGESFNRKKRACVRDHGGTGACSSSCSSSASSSSSTSCAQVTSPAAVRERFERG